MIEVDQITPLHRTMVELWHCQEIHNPYHDFLHLVCEEHKFNFQLWHEEDIARSPDVDDSRITAVKRAIDRFNQLRNDAIERIDDDLMRRVEQQGVAVASDAPLNTETPGSAIDRLSILSLRIYHMEEQAARSDATPDHLERVRQKLPVLYSQREDLATSLAELLADIFTGRKRMRIYRQFKMYNDPSLNPYMYGSQTRKIA